MIRLSPDFKEFIQLLNANHVEYLLVGGYAVAFHGYPRATGDIDFWIAAHPANAEKVVRVLRNFGFAQAHADQEILTQPGRIIRMGVPPVRIELQTSISGVDFADCQSRAIDAVLDGVPVKVLSLPDLILNKQAAGRHKDLNDLENLRG